VERVDFVVVGQGLAGTALAWQLRRRGRRVVVIDRGEGVSASRVAAGLVTPVTGKRLAKSWRWDELYPAAVSFYRSIEAATGTSLFHERPTVRILADAAERAEYERRSGDVLAGLVREGELNRDWFDAPFGAFEMPAAARLDVGTYLDVSRAVFARDGGWREGEVDLAADIELASGGVRLSRMGLQAEAVVICRGYSAAPDPWFGSVRFNAAKGEILTLRVPGLREERVVHRGIWLAPLGGVTFRAGSTYEWDDLTPAATAAGRERIEGQLRRFLRLPWEVIEHRAAVRPVIDAGYPVLGRHPRFPQIAYFNGLGSKGSLLAPFFAEQLARCLVGEGSVEPQADVRGRLT
jgi:glycine/D-amino acid oxidase-like deaminating enzyme